MAKAKVESLRKILNFVSLTLPGQLTLEKIAT